MLPANSDAMMELQRGQTSQMWGGFLRRRNKHLLAVTSRLGREAVQPLVTSQRAGLAKKLIRASAGWTFVYAAEQTMSKYTTSSLVTYCKWPWKPCLWLRTMCARLNINPTALECFLFLFCLLLSPMMWTYYHPSWVSRSWGRGPTSVSKTELSIKKQLFPAFPPFSVNELMCLCELQEF